MKLIILDRDGVINEDSDDYIKCAEEWIPIPGSMDAIARLSNAGYTIAVATNQSGVGRRLFDEYELASIHQTMAEHVEEAGGTLHGVFFCPHTPDDGCQCRKPAIGLFSQIESEFGTSVQGAPFVGDTVTDIAAARMAGCIPILVRTGKGERTLEQGSKELAGVDVYDDLAAFADHLLGPAA
jgi:D-glycero-D-manno-heptose 1,7-bisphosphate phosphatase